MLLTEPFPQKYDISTTLTFDLTSPSQVDIRVYDELGKEVAAPVRDSPMGSGTYSFAIGKDELFLNYLP